MTRILESGRAIGQFLHNCTTLTQIDITADEEGKATAGCRCCNTCSRPVPAGLNENANMCAVCMTLNIKQYCFVHLHYS